jgi:RecG-like helicase
MALNKRQKHRFWLLIAFVVLGYAASFYQPAPIEEKSAQQLYQDQQSNAQLEINGTVKRILQDDVSGIRHQRFIVEIVGGQTILIAHNIDLSPRIDDLQVGDEVSVYGEYEWNEHGGVIYWTHHDPKGKHEGGWVKHNGNTYQ